MVLRPLILLKDETVLYKDVEIATIVCSKDTSEVLKNTIYDLLTADLKLLNESKLVLAQDENGIIDCSLKPKTSLNEPGETAIDDIDIFNNGDLKWQAMLAGMEGHSGHWCIHCLLSPSQWKVFGHAPGEKRTFESILATVAEFGIDEFTASHPKFRGVAAEPFWPFLLLWNFAVAVLHCRIGIFNDTDNWFQDLVNCYVKKSPEERKILQAIAEFDSNYEAARASIEEFDASADGKERARLSRRRNKTLEEAMNLAKLQFERKRMADLRDSWRKKRTDAKKDLVNYQSRQRLVTSSFYFAMEEHWRGQDLSREAYHGGSWNGNDAKAVMRDPRKYYSGMREVLINWKLESTKEEDIDELLGNVIELLERWNRVFVLLMSKTRTPEVKADLKVKDSITMALRLHRELELPIRPKVHSIEDHAFEQFCTYPFPLYYLIEENVELNHQIGHREEELVKRIRNDEMRARAKATRMCINIDSRVQQTINEVHSTAARGPRGPYKKRKTAQTAEAAATPPPQAPLARVTDERATSPPPAPPQHDVEHQMNSLVSSVPIYSPPRTS